jgi:hypothetical protein
VTTGASGAVGVMVEDVVTGAAEVFRALRPTA